MARSLQEYVTETVNSYAPAQQAIQAQINALSGQLAETEKNINAQFAQQQQTLDNQRQTAASNASMQAAGSGGSFGGKANIANRNYYRDTFVPAQTQLQTNQSQALSEARQRSDNQRLSLSSQLANLLAQAQSQALSRYDNGLQLDWDKDKFNQNLAWQKDQYNQNMAWEKEKWAQQLAENAKSRAAQASSLSRYYGGGASGGGGNSGNRYGQIRNDDGYHFYDTQTGDSVRFGTYLSGLDGGFNANLLPALNDMALSGDANAQRVLREIKNGAKFVQNTGSNFQDTGNGAYNALGIKKVN